jgi:hypothetical protein
MHNIGRNRKINVLDIDSLRLRIIKLRIYFRIDR